MEIGVNVPNFGPGTRPDVLRSWAGTVEGLGFDLLMVSDHVVVTSDVAQQYPAPFYEPFTTLSWMAGITDRVRLGTTTLIVPYRHPPNSAAAHRRAGHRRGTARRRGHDRADPRRSGAAAHARRRDGGARPVHRRPARDPPSRDGPAGARHGRRQHQGAGMTPEDE